MKHYNPTIAEDANRIFATKTMDMVGAEVNPTIQPNVEIKRVSDFFIEGSITNSTSGTIGSIPADKDVYIVAMTFSMIKDATATATLFNLKATINGVSKTILTFAGLTLTADSKDIAIAFVNPIKVDRGSDVTINADTNVANFRCRATVIGYKVETTR